MRRSSALIGVLAVASTIIVGPVPAAHAYSARGRVVHVADGDTYDINIYGDGTRTPVRVRMIGIQAMEEGQCGAASAENRLEDLIEGKVVTITARYASSSGMRDRPQRFTYVDGVDVGRKMLAGGYVIPFPHPVEDSKNATYLKAAQVAASKGIRMWNTDRCDVGPRQGTRIKVYVRYDAPGDDKENVNGEIIKIYNYGSTALPIAGWWARDSALRRYTFPKGASVPAGGSVTLHVGKGSNSGTHYYWGLSSPAFSNGDGDGAYLFDPDGDLRAWMMYPCYYACG